ncbi:MAG: reverse transcriptase domain-containing protein [Erysipelotrichaceae bacterium]
MNTYIKARKEVAELIGIELKELNRVLYKEKVDNLYKTFNIPKKNGGVRVIHAPKDRLKYIQRKLSDKLAKIHQDYLDKNNIKSVISHGFQKGKSIMTNAYVHNHKKFILNIDISDFFPSFNFGRVRGYFIKSKEFNFSKEVSTIIAQLACHDGKLPQGAPTSPMISNLIFNIVDLRILALAKKYKLDYTRYADDLSFSTNNKAFERIVDFLLVIGWILYFQYLLFLLCLFPLSNLVRLLFFL